MSFRYKGALSRTSGGSAGVENFVFNENLSSQIIDEGENKEFILQFIFASNTTQLYINGLCQLNGVDYLEIAPNRIRLIESLLEGDSIIIDYIKI